MTYQQYLDVIALQAFVLCRLLSDPQPDKASWRIRLAECLDTLRGINTRHELDAAIANRYPWQMEDERR